jgi:tRNA U34 5-methylaminomethyl-2-thiouridine-forming methyltransferase MnmC
MTWPACGADADDADACAPDACGAEGGGGGGREADATETGSADPCGGAGGAAGGTAPGEGGAARSAGTDGHAGRRATSAAATNRGATDAGASDAKATSSEATAGDLAIRRGGDGSLSLWSAAFGEGFHSARGALREGRETFLHPSELGRFQRGQPLRVLEVCAGTGSNLALLLEACADRGLALQWWGLELDPRPLALALAQPAFRDPWPPRTLACLESLQHHGRWRQASSAGRMLWGDARQRLEALEAGCGGEPGGAIDLIWHDAFSPQRCPQLWSCEFLARLARLLAPQGRWISYCSAAAVRQALRLAHLHLAALPAPSAPTGQLPHRRQAHHWSGGTVASPRPLAPSTLWRPLTAMEWDHLASGAGEPYRDPAGTASAAAILARRHQAQAAAQARGERSSSSAWRRRWGLERGSEASGTGGG